MNFKNFIEKGAEEYGGLPFWSWNDKLEPEELKRQMGVMKKLGMNGFFMHARGGLETEYLSDEWYNCIKTCVDEAKKLGMEAWAYDENGWPSGFAGGKVLENPKNLATYLKMVETDEFPELDNNEAPKTHCLAIYKKTAEGYTRIFEKPAEKAELAIIYQHYDESYIDALDKRVIDEFIKYTHEEYKAKLGDDFGCAAMPGFFTDEPQYYRYATCWSNTMPVEFEKAYGYDVFEKLIALFRDFPGADEFRFDYWYLAHKLFINNFQKNVYDWCHANNCKITGHAIEETTMFTQMWCCGGVMPFYEYEDIPGMDYLGRSISSDLGPKQLGSVSAQLGKPMTLTESFAACGWDVSPTELKKILDLQFAGGVNKVCQHLYPYSIRGQRKRDYPANYSEHLPWQNAFGDFVKYYARLGFLLSRGVEKADTLIIHPMHSEYLTYRREGDHFSVADVDNDIFRVIRKFSDNQIDWHFGDEELMAKYGSVEGNTLKIGKMSYKYVVIPYCKTLDTTTVEFLKEFQKNGGKILVENKMPERVQGRIADYSWLKSNCTFEEIKSAASIMVTAENAELVNDVKVMARETEFGTLYYITNVSGKSYPEVAITIKNAKDVSELLLEESDVNADKIAVAPNFSIEGADIVIKTSLEDGESHVFITGFDKNDFAIDDKALKNGAAIHENAKKIELSGDYKILSAADNALTLDYAMLSLDGGKTFQKPKPIVQIFAELLEARFRGTVALKYIFDIKKMPEHIYVCVEPMKFTSFKVNCAECPFIDMKWLDPKFKVADIKDFCAGGRNVIDMAFDYYQDDYVYHVLFDNVMESLRNCLNFNTEVESIYIFGDFSVNTEADKFAELEKAIEYTGKFSIGAKAETVNAKNLTTAGFPFFAGEITLEKKFELTQDFKAPEIWVKGRYAYADVFVNDEFVKRLMFTQHTDITSFVKPGENTLKIKLCNSNRNLLGPHHHENPEPTMVGPTTFSHENQWANGQCATFRDRYAFVRYGIDVEIIDKE